ncbi:MAG: aldehyde dehydrogenase family protein [Pseudomonadota bacterium]
MALTDIPASVSTYLDKHHAHFIDGGEVNSSGGETISVVDPSSGQPVSQIADATLDDVNAAVASARHAFESHAWQSMKPAQRAALLHAFADRIEANADQLAMLESIDGGKPIALAKPVDVMATVGAFRYYAGWADKINGTTNNISMDGEHHAFTLREPVGVAALIVPWNYPLVMAGMKLAPALAAGCACVLKPAEDTSLTALRLGELAIEAGFPAGIVNVLTGRGAIAGQALAEHPGVDKVAFTGSTATGKRIVQAAAGNLKKVTLELGGKSPNIIFGDADLEKAIPASAMGIFFNTGQVCTAASRLYVHRSVYDQVVDGIAGVAGGLQVGHSRDYETLIGPLISARQLERVSSYIETGKKEGGEVVYGGNRIGDDGFFVSPTVITGVKNDMTIVKEEIFGPVLVAQAFDEMEEVIALANDTEYGLSSAVWTKDISTAHQVARRLRTGQVGVNQAAVADWNLPIGGYKQSGWGRENGYDGLANYLQTKAVAIAL